MDFLIEFIAELFLEGIFEAGTNKKIPKLIRYPLLLIIVLIYVLLIGGLLLIGINLIKENLIGAIVIFIVDLFLLILTIYAFKQKIRNVKNK